MSLWDDIRSKARSYHMQACAKADGDVAARALLLAAADFTGIRARPRPAGDSLLNDSEAVLDRDVQTTIWYSEGIPLALVDFYIAHEYAHYWLDDEQASCRSEDCDPEAIIEPPATGVQQVEGYGPHERRERMANVFAREFLLPADSLKQWYLADGLDAAGISQRVRLPLGMVFHQLGLALLTPDPLDPTTPNVSSVGSRSDALDPSQQDAAFVPTGPLLLDAGPGTGKTRTLVGRVLFLLQEGVPPGEILVLTFSNRAAEELRQRIAQAAHTAAPYIWIGTFHAYGLELLRKFGSALRLPANPSILDPVAGLFLLERLLPDLPLQHYQYLPEPTMHLPALLRAISRAKDELAGPDHYLGLAEAMLECTKTDAERQMAEKALEVAAVYSRYQAELDENRMLDFGDLILRPVQLLRTHDDIRDGVRGMHSHILVDEYQDVNRASGLLLREVAGSGEGLWVVGDPRQAIYRFRGATTANIGLFSTDFPGATTRSLRHNYRSQEPVIAAFSTFATTMRATQHANFPTWEAKRPTADGRATLAIANSHQTEVIQLVRTIKEHYSAGIPYRDQAILCRTHATLAKMALGLEQAGVPVLYLGDLFERAEVRDLLALLSLSSEGDGSGLVRVARFPEYQIPWSDVGTLLHTAREQDAFFPRALGLAETLDTISPQGRERLALLARHLDGISFGTSAWSFLTQYLFCRSDYIRLLLRQPSGTDQQQRLALFQFLQVAYTQRGITRIDSEDPKRAFLRYVRRVELVGDEKQLGQVPEWAAGFDAVRLHTVHASKGLEFAVVYLPDLRAGAFPSSGRPNLCPPPLGLIPTDPDSEKEEEECLFFVALSRARDHLYLSRPTNYAGNKSNPSKFINSLGAQVPSVLYGPVVWGGEFKEPTAPPPPLAADTLQAYSANALDQYMRCGRRYYYEFVLRLRGIATSSPYIRFHQCVHHTLSWIREQRAQGLVVSETSALEELRRRWETAGPRDDPYEAIYRQSAELMVVRAVDWAARPMSENSRPEWEIDLPHGRVSFKPDYVGTVEDEGQIRHLVQRLRTGRYSDEERTRDLHSLYVEGAHRFLAGAPYSVQLVYLATGDVVNLDVAARTVATNLHHYDAAIAGIRQQDFPARPNDRECPRCPFYFICPVAEDP